MSLDDLKALTDAFGPGGGLLVALGMLAVGVLFPVLKRERQAAKSDVKVPVDLVSDADVLVFMTEHKIRLASVENRLSKLEDKCGD